jgi:hypothetical protein
MGIPWRLKGDGGCKKKFPQAGGLVVQHYPFIGGGFGMERNSAPEWYSRSGGFGGSGQAIQEEIARRGYLEQMADLDAQSLQGAFESGAGLYGKEIADRLAAQQAGESQASGKCPHLLALGDL